MTHEELQFALDADKTKNTKYVFLYHSNVMLNGNDIVPFICKRSEIHLGKFGVNFGDRAYLCQLAYKRIVSMDKCDDCTFGTC